MPKILIVMTLPYRPDNQTRALETYFHNWPKEKMAQLYSSNEIPKQGICSTFFQITDYDILKRFFGKKDNIGRIYSYENLSNDYSTKEQTNNKLNRFKKRTWFRFYLRKWLWGSKRWYTKELYDWVSEFKPEAIYCGTSDDYFIMEISYVLSKDFNIPIIISIGDDYYFLKRTPLLYQYQKSYKRIFEKIMNTDGFAIYISDKIANQYNSYFRKQGFAMYLGSDIVENDKKIDNYTYSFNYFGNLELGRSKSLALLGNALKKINSSFTLNIYCETASKTDKKLLEKCNCSIHKAIPYKEVINIMNSGSFNIVASGFRNEDIEKSRYSLSTKISDCLASCGPIIAIGPNGDGAIDYLKNNRCAIILDSQNICIEDLREKIYNKKYLTSIIKNAKICYQNNHSTNKNRQKFEYYCSKIKKD